MSNRSFNNETTWDPYFDQSANNTTQRVNDPYLFVSPNLFPLLKVFCIFCYSITFVVGIVGNSLVIWIAGFKVKTVNALWFFNLAIADFICSAFLPARIVEWSLFTEHSYPYQLCMVSSVVLVFSMCSSVYFLTVISADRCVSIGWPIWTRIHRTLNKARVISVIIWAFCLILSAPITAYYFDTDFSDCAAKDIQIYYSHSDDLVKSLRIIRFACMFALPFAIILISYGLLFYKLKKRMKRIHHQSYRMVITVVVVFFICWFPYYTWPFVHIGRLDFLLDNLINEICICLAYFNSCINPVVYVFFSRDFKHSFFKSIPARLEKAFTDRYELKGGEEDIGPNTLVLKTISKTVD